VNSEKTELETTPSENGRRDGSGKKIPGGPGKPSEPPLGKEAPPAPEKSGSFLALLAFLLAVAALAVAGWTWWQGLAAEDESQAQLYTEIARLNSANEELSLKIGQVRGEVDALSSEDVDAAFDAMQNRMETDRQRLADLETTLQEQQALSRSLQAAANAMQGRLQAAEAAVSGLSTRELDAGGELDLAEVDYLLRLANERLRLFADPEAADDALEVADMHLAALDNPMYLGVRQDIAAARRELAAIELPAFLEIAGRLDAVQAAIPGLVFMGEEAPVQEPMAEEEQGWWAKVKSTFSSLVTVRPSTVQENQRISLEYKDYVRQRVWLQLEIAHLALMRRDQAAFRNSLARVDEAVNAWFEPGVGSFDTVSDGIGELMALDIETEMPDITAPWTTLRLLRQAPVAAPSEMAPKRDETAAAVEDETDGDGDEPQ
jgi:uroporphyrin-3 C-methyltransferase